MDARRPARRLIVLVLLLAAVSGCQALHRYRPVPVLARDAETKKPIPEAEVRISYPMSQSSLTPDQPVEKTGPDGIARLRAAPFGEIGIKVQANARGYLDEETYLSVAEVQAIEPAHLFESVEQRPACVVVDLFAEPHPTVELIVPAGYRGTIKAELHVREDVACPPGQRCFRYPVEPSGRVDVTGPRLLRHVYGPDFRARYSDGAPLGREARGAEVGLWWVKSEANCHHLFVGTRSELDRHLPEEKSEGVESVPARGGKGGGRGRRNRGGSSPSGDPGAGG
jgi:hypothetical protein